MAGQWTAVCSSVCAGLHFTAACCSASLRVCQMGYWAVVGVGRCRCWWFCRVWWGCLGLRSQQRIAAPVVPTLIDRRHGPQVSKIQAQLTKAAATRLPSIQVSTPRRAAVGRRGSMWPRERDCWGDRCGRGKGIVGRQDAMHRALRTASSDEIHVRREAAWAWICDGSPTCCN